MADKMVALVGPGKGPLMHTSRMGQLLVKFRELTDGHALIWHNDRLVDAEYKSDLDLAIPSAGTLQIEYVGKSKKFMCIIQTHPDALHRARPNNGTASASDDPGSATH